MKEKNFLKHFFIIGGGTAINLVLGIFTTPLITRLVDPVEYGQLSIFTMYSNMALMFFLLGMDQAVIRFYYEKDTIEYKRALLFKCVEIPTIITLVASVMVIGCSYLGWVKFEFSTIIMALLCLYTFIQVIYRFSHNLLRLEYKTKVYSGLNIIQKLSYVLLAVPLLLFFKRDYLLLLVIATVGAALVCFIVSIAVQKKMWNITSNNPAACDIPMQELLRYSTPLIISMGITTLFQAIDKLSLNHYCSYTEVGIYSSTMTLVNIFAILQTTFNTLWAPMAVEHFTHNKEDRSFYQKGNQIITIVMFFCGLSLILCKNLFAVLLGEKYREAAYILPFLIFHPIMYTISETTVTGITFMKKSQMQILVAATACVTNLIGNTILVPKLGCRGAAISTGLSYIVFFTMRTVVSNKYFYVDFKLKRFYLLTVCVCIYAFYNTFVSFNAGAIIGYIICVAVLIILYRDTIVMIFNYTSKYIENLKKKE